MKTITDVLLGVAGQILVMHIAVLLTGSNTIPGPLSLLVLITGAAAGITFSRTVVRRLMND